MDIKYLLSHVDHTLLKPDCTWKQIKQICEDGIKYGTASVCIPPAFVKRAAGYAAGRVKICTVIGFPNGYATTASKVYETEDAVSNGADEIDAVINIGALKEGNLKYLGDEILEIRKACPAQILKIIIETCLLTDAEKREMCRITAESGADYIKTSTGFSKGGASLSDVRLLSECAPAGLKVKAAGGISTIEAGFEFLRAGADRIGASRIVKLVREGNLL